MINFSPRQFFCKRHPTKIIALLNPGRRSLQRPDISLKAASASGQEKSHIIDNSYGEGRRSRSGRGRGRSSISFNGATALLSVGQGYSLGRLQHLKTYSHFVRDPDVADPSRLFPGQVTNRWYQRTEP
jgi:hypothetical protein